jgi:hypothetical protein
MKTMSVQHYAFVMFFARYALFIRIIIFNRVTVRFTSKANVFHLRFLSALIHTIQYFSVFSLRHRRKNSDYHFSCSIGADPVSNEPVGAAARVVKMVYGFFTGQQNDEISN